MRRVRGGVAASACAVAFVVLTGLVAPASAYSPPTNARPAAASGSGAAHVHITARKRIGARVVELTISTPAFTTPTKVDVDLPVGYHRQPHRRWPVAYVLAGTMNTYATFNDFVHGLKLTRKFPAIVVSPNGDSGYWSDWYNDGAFGPPKYETYVIDQLIPLIDAKFRTKPHRSERAVAGVSMGGYGAMMLAARHPDLFADAASISGAVDSTPAPLATALAVSPEFQGAPANSIYGPQATQEVRWHGHNPTDIAENLRGLDLEVLTANGTPDPGIGEKTLSADSVSCVIEAGVHLASVEFNKALNKLRIGHRWHDYGPGCHTAANFEREISATVTRFAKEFKHPPHRRRSFDYTSIEPTFHVWGWTVRADRTRALEFLDLRNVHRHGLTLVGSGTTTVTTPPLFRGMKRVHLAGATTSVARPDARGRITFAVDLGAADIQQEDTPGAATIKTRRTVTFARR